MSLHLECDEDTVTEMFYQMDVTVSTAPHPPRSTEIRRDHP